MTKHWQRASQHVGLGDNAVSQSSKYFKTLSYMDHYESDFANADAIWWT